MSNSTDADDSTDDGQRRTRRGFLAAAGAAGLGAAALGGQQLVGRASAEIDETLTVRLENVSTGTTLQTTAEGDAAEQPVPLSPGAFAVHSYPAEPIFSDGEPERNNGLEEIAEGGRPGRLAESVAGQNRVHQAGAFTTPVGADGPGPLLPGDTYEFEVDVTGSYYLSFATMFIPSNDLFYAPEPTGIRLTQARAPATGVSDVRTGDFTDAVGLWDAGTEVNQEPGVGDNQVQRQRGGGGSNVGDVEREVVTPVSEINGYDYPAVSDVLELTVED